MSEPRRPPAVRGGIGSAAMSDELMLGRTVEQAEYGRLDTFPVDRPVQVVFRTDELQALCPAVEGIQPDIYSATISYTAVTAACLLVRREVFEKVGGFDERLAVGYNDTDFCLRVRAAGYKNILATCGCSSEYTTRIYNHHPWLQNCSFKRK